MDIRSAQKQAWQNKVAKGFNTTDIPLEFCLLQGEIAEAFDAWRKGREDLGEERLWRTARSLARGDPSIGSAASLPPIRVLDDSVKRDVLEDEDLTLDIEPSELVCRQIHRFG